MKTEQKKALLVVSFGTSYADTRKKNIEHVESVLKNAFPDRCFYHAYTSQMILDKLRNRDHIFIPNVNEAMEQMHSDGIIDVLVQPTHIMHGIENDMMRETILSFSSQFQKLQIGAPLLNTTQDQFAVIQAMTKELPQLSETEAIVLMGHGTTHYANSIYAALDYAFKQSGFPHIHVGTVEAYPGLWEIISALKANHTSHVYLAPFMLVAGDHATNDLAGEEEDSWKSILETNGFTTECILKGLGEYEGICELYTQHAKAAGH